MGNYRIEPTDFGPRLIRNTRKIGRKISNEESAVAKTIKEEDPAILNITEIGVTNPTKGKKIEGEKGMHIDILA